MNESEFEKIKCEQKSLMQKKRKKNPKFMFSPALFFTSL